MCLVFFDTFTTYTSLMSLEILAKFDDYKNFTQYSN